VSGTHFSIGIDVGATKTHLVAQSAQNNGRVELTGPAANPKRIGMERATQILTTLIGKALADNRPVGQVSICAGVAGAGRSDEQSALADRLAARLHDIGAAIRVDVVHDALIALETAFGTGSGLVVIVGTGSVSVARTHDGDLARVGGWGHLLGDPGSGYAIGQQGLRAVAEDFEGGPETSLRDAVGRRFDINDRDELIRVVYDEEFYIQDVAPLVAEAAAADDPVASEILDTQFVRLARQVEWLLNRCSGLDSRIALLGGMLRSAHYAETLQRALQARFGTWSVEVLEDDPVVGALRRAHRLNG
jgi:N-acetylglucosamine kinase-like BadF-type ATPase